MAMMGISRPRARYVSLGLPLGQVSEGWLDMAAGGRLSVSRHGPTNHFLLARIRICCLTYLGLRSGLLVVRRMEALLLACGHWSRRCLLPFWQCLRRRQSGRADMPPSKQQRPDAAEKVKVSFFFFSSVSFSFRLQTAMRKDRDQKKNRQQFLYLFQKQTGDRGRIERAQATFKTKKDKQKEDLERGRRGPCLAI